MYEKFYRLTGIPFQLTPDSRFFFGSAGHNRAISHLVYGLAQEEGFIVITGEVGAGKTTLVEQLWSQLDRRTYVLGRVVTTQVSGDDLLRLIVTSYGIDDGGADKATLLRRFEKMVREQRAQGGPRPARVAVRAPPLLERPFLERPALERPVLERPAQRGSLPLQPA